MALPTVEETQSAILKALDASPSGAVEDSQKLSVGSTSLSSQEGQGVVKSALFSLQSKEVGGDYAELGLAFRARSRAAACWRSVTETGQPT